MVFKREIGNLRTLPAKGCAAQTLWRYNSSTTFPRSKLPRQCCSAAHDCVSISRGALLSLPSSSADEDDDVLDGLDGIKGALYKRKDFLGVEEEGTVPSFLALVLHRTERHSCAAWRLAVPARFSIESPSRRDLHCIHTFASLQQSCTLVERIITEPWTSTS